MKKLITIIVSVLALGVAKADEKTTAYTLHMTGVT